MKNSRTNMWEPAPRLCLGSNRHDGGFPEIKPATMAQWKQTVSCAAVRETHEAWASTAIVLTAFVRISPFGWQETQH